MVKFQSLALVYADEPYAVLAVALYGFAADVFFPQVEKRADVGRSVVQEVGHLVVEGIEVSALVAEPLQGEVVEDVFQNVEEGLFEYLVVAADEMLGEFAVEIALVVLPEQDDVFFVGTIVEHMLLIGHGKAHLVEHVVGMDEQAQGKHDDVDGQ